MITKQHPSTRPHVDTEHTRNHKDKVTRTQGHFNKWANDSLKTNKLNNINEQSKTNRFNHAADYSKTNRFNSTND